ncbi:GATA transcription factor 4-like [Typha latifolia]|uniref:GATA transcription factor 4-like n=1 Tax=Typha latifolia TaxID=4733 RepID=UPI003C307B2A
MASEWGMGMGMGDFFSNASNVVTTPVMTTTTTTIHSSPAHLYGLQSTDALRVDDLLDFSNHDLFSGAGAVAADGDNYFIASATTEPTSKAITSRPFSGDHTIYSSFPDDLYIPSEEAAELEWLSNFVDDSFSDMPYPSSSAANPIAPAGNIPSLVTARGARSKRLRSTWSSLVPAAAAANSSPSSSSSSSTEMPSFKSKDGNCNNNGGKKKGGGEMGREGGVRRCTHCASEKTPQWRTGPLGPKTLCNACGVRYKSGRLVPEYRPAASPTFVLTQHSNSHRKVMELRRQKEVLLVRHRDGPSAAAASGELLFHDYGVC